jgi:hypothetical protein
MKSYRLTTFVVLSVLLISTACNAPFNRGESPEDDLQAEGPENVVRLLAGLESGSTFILVVDPDGDPIFNARIANTDLYTDHNGIAVGLISTTSQEWFPVYAPGYATAYTRAITEWDGYPIALTILTPLGASALVESDSVTTLTVENARREQAQVSMQAGTFDDPQVLLSWSDIPITQLGSRFGSTSGMEGLFLQGAFALETTSLESGSWDIQPEKEVSLRITWDPEREEIPVLGSFNPESGTWESLVDRCQRDEAGMMECTLPHLSEFGLFGHSSGGDGWDRDEDENDDFANSFGSALDNAMGGGAGGAAGGGVPGGGTEGGDGDSGGSEGGLTGGLDGLSGSGDGLGTEVDKMTALIAAGLAMQNGLDGLANQYLDQAREAIKEMANELLKDPTCGTVYELFNAASQAWLVGELDALGDQLSQRAQDIFKRCGAWYGTIHYTFKLQNTWPHANDWQHESGSSAWTEVHEVRIFVDPKTGAIDGESHVHLAFSDATYRLEKQSPCGPIHNDHDAKTEPGDGTAILLFDGTFDGDNFSIGELRVEKSEPIALQHHAWLSKTFAEPIAPPPSCPPITTKEISTQTIAEYTSQLIHGFFGQPEPPSLQEMLRTGSRRMSEDRVVGISGYQDISYDVGRNLSPLLPVESGTVRWNFTRVSEGSK